MLLARVIAKLEPGGAQLTALRLTPALRRHRIETRLLAGEATAEGLELFARAGLEVDVWDGATGLQYACEQGFPDWLEPRLADADVVHAQMFGGWWAAARAIPPTVPLVASEHNAVRWPSAREIEARTALLRVNRFLAHSPAAREFAEARGLPADRLAVGLSAIDPRVQEPDRSLPRRRIVYAGRLHPEKGPDLLLEALARMSSPPPTYILGSGAMEAELRALCARLDLEATVRFCGWREQPGRWIRRASACVVPSRYEAWSQTAVQAMVLGTPVVGTAVEGLPLTLGEGRGILVPPGDPDALALAIEEVVSRRRLPDLAAARRYALQFTPELGAERYARLYGALVEHRRIAAPLHPPRRRRSLAPAPAIAAR